jgi:hypothetical protein
VPQRRDKFVSANGRGCNTNQSTGNSTWDQQEKLSRTGLSANIIIPGIIYQVTDMVNSLLVDHVRKELMAYLN